MNRSNVDVLLSLPPVCRSEVTGVDRPRTKEVPRRSAPNGNLKKKSESRFRDLNSFVDSSMSSCTAAEVKVWFVLFRDARHGTATTSQNWIGERAGVNVRSVRRAIRTLEKRGLLKVELDPESWTVA